MTLTQAGEPERLPVGVISHGVLPSLGITPRLGRAFTAGDDPPGANAVVLLSDGLWRRRFAADRNVVGRRIWLDRQPFTIVGVLPPGFRLPRELDSPDPSQAFVPLGLDRTTVPIRGSHFLTGVARLRPNVSPGQAAADIGRVAARFATELPADYPPSMKFAATVTPLSEDVVGDARPLLLVLLGAVGFVLLVACANIANLFLSRGERRQHEFAVRTALGGGPLAAGAGTMTESALVALAGGTVGLVCANAAGGLLLALRPAGLPRLDTISFDWTVAALPRRDGGGRGDPGRHRPRRARVAQHGGSGARRRQGLDRRAGASPRPRRPGSRRGGAVDRAVDRRGPVDAQFLEPAVGRPRLPDRPDPDRVDHAADVGLSRPGSGRRSSSSPCSTACARSLASRPPVR